MKTAQATLKNFRQAPRKMRLVVNSIRGKKVSDALVNLDFITKRASLPIKNLVMSALANAKNLDIPTDNLIIKTIRVDSGSIMYRRRPASRGSAHPIRKRTSSVFVELGEAEPKNKKVKVVKEMVEKTKEDKSLKVKKRASKASK